MPMTRFSHNISEEAGQTFEHLVVTLDVKKYELIELMIAVMAAIPEEMQDRLRSKRPRTERQPDAPQTGRRDAADSDGRAPRASARPESSSSVDPRSFRNPPPFGLHQRRRFSCAKATQRPPTTGLPK